MAYRINAPRFEAESFENDVVILDVEGGGLQMLLWLDPVDDDDATGWPNAPST